MTRNTALKVIAAAITLSSINGAALVQLDGPGKFIALAFSAAAAIVVGRVLLAIWGTKKAPKLGRKYASGGDL